MRRTTETFADALSQRGALQKVRDKYGMKVPRQSDRGLPSTRCSTERTLQSVESVV